MTTSARLDLVASLAPNFRELTGDFDASMLRAWLEADLGSAEALDGPVSISPGRFLSRARPLSPLLVVVSSNTPHAAAQSLLRSLVLGAETCFKLPAAGLPRFEELLAGLPGPLGGLVDHSPTLPADWQERFEGIVVYGNDDTITWFSERVAPHVRLLKHGARLAIARVDGGIDEAAALAARDASLFDQQGCLSLHNVYLSPSAGCSIHHFGERLATAMAEFAREHPRRELSLSEAGSISNLRETIRYRSASAPDSCQIRESEGSTQWTVISEDDPRIQASCLNRVVYVKPWPESRSALGPGIRHLSACALHPWNAEAAASLTDLPVSRVCPLGTCQAPPTTWHHDGLAALGTLVRWTDLA